jgi:acyl-CoA oxidase
MRQFLERVKDVVPGRNDPDAEGGLFDSDYHLAMMRWREEHMTSGVARRLKGGIDKGGDPAVVFSRCQNHLLAAAHAHAERLVLEAFLTAVSTMPEGPERTLLESVQHLHALAEIERDRAWWIEHGRLTTERAKAITRAVDHLCNDLAKHAVTLVDAFGVPEELLPRQM